MKTFTALFFAFLIAITTQSCAFSGDLGINNKRVKGSSTYVTKKMKVADFNEIALAGSGEVIYTQATGRPKVEVYTSDNLVELLDIKVENNQLSIRFKNGYSVSYNKLIFRVSSPHIEGVSVAGSGNVKFANGLKTDELKLSIAGSGNIEGSAIDCTNELKVSIAGSGNVNIQKVACSDLDTSIAGSGDISLKEVSAGELESSIAGSGNTTITGTAQEATYSIAGSGDMNVEKLEAQRVSANIRGSGNIKCHATEFLKANRSGSGSIGYKGNPSLEISKKGVYKL